MMWTWRQSACVHCLDTIRYNTIDWLMCLCLCDWVSAVCTVGGGVVERDSSTVGRRPVLSQRSVPRLSVSSTRASTALPWHGVAPRCRIRHRPQLPTTGVYDLLLNMLKILFPGFVYAISLVYVDRSSIDLLWAFAASASWACSRLLCIGSRS